MCTTTPRRPHRAEAVDALAYTVGRHVVFGAGQYRPVDDQGRQLIAHELTHVVHQGGAEYAAGPLSVSRPDDAAETEASAVAAAVRAGSSNAVAHDHTAAHTAALFRQPKPQQQQQQPTPAQNYQQALTTIQQKDAEVYRFLTGTSLNSKTKVHGGAITDTSTTPATTITFVFNLNVTTASLPRVATRSSMAAFLFLEARIRRGRSPPT